MSQVKRVISYEKWLQQKGYRPTTIKSYYKSQTQLTRWLQKESLAFDAKGILAFLAACEKQGMKQGSLVQYHLRICRYSEYLVETGKLGKAPIQNWKMVYKSRHSSDCYLLLNASHLEQLYGLYRAYPKAKLQAEVLLGLTIFQAIHNQEIYQLKAKHLLLDQGKIELPGYGGKQNPRILALQAIQILALHHLVQIRQPNELLLQYSNKWAAHKMRWNIKERLKKLCTDAKINIPLKHLQQLRASRIALWVNSEDLRIAQYKAGHKRIHSTEKYIQQDLTKLKSEIEKYHPLQNF